MKWPEYLVLIRHGVSKYNLLKGRKEADSLYQAFVLEWEKDPASPRTVELAKEVWQKFSLGVSDADTPLADVEGKQAFATGMELKNIIEVPDVIFVSPYKRTLDTLSHIQRGWPDLNNVRLYREDRIREQEHGLVLLYNDWRVFQALHPEQGLLRQLEGPYWYRFPQGENVPDVRERNRSWLSTLVRDFTGKKVLVVTHHLNILATRANLERWDADEFLRVDKEEKPINCGVTLYRGYPHEGMDGHLKLEFYNKKYY